MLHAPYPVPVPSAPRWLALLAALLIGGAADAQAPSDGQVGGAPAVLRSGVAFVPNRGQWDARAAFRAEADGQTAWFGATGWTLAVEERADHEQPGPGAGRRGVALRMSFVDGAPASLRGERRRNELRHWFTGERAVTDVPAFDSLRYAGIWPGTDVAIHARDGALEYDLCLLPGADVARIVLRCEGAESLEVAEDGALLVHTALGALRQPAPRTWAVLPDGRREILECRYRLVGADSFGFELPGSGRGLPVVIDPVLQWASYLGGTSLELVHAVTANGAGITVAGATSVSNFPATAGAYDASWNGQQDAFVSRLSPDGGTLLYSTFLGGSKDEEARAVALDADGTIVVAGWTSSANFPTSTTAFDRTYNGGTGTLRSDAFAVRLTPSGSGLVFGSYLGGSKDDLASSVGLDAEGRVHLAGKTSSTNFPVSAGAFDGSYNGGSTDVGDAFLACFAADGATLPSSTFLGGAADEFANALRVEADGTATLAGWTSSSGFPVTPGALDTELSGTSDAFVARLPAGGGSLAFSTLLGGGQDDNALALARSEDGALHVAGTTLSADFPVTPAASQPGYAGGLYFGDAFLATLDAAGSALQSATFLGGSGDDVATGLGVDPAGALVVGGWTQSGDLPVTPGAPDSTLGGSTDGFLARLDAADGTLLHAGYLGGPSQDKAYGLALTADGGATLAGYTNSADFPVTAGSYDTHFDGFEGLIGDAFLAHYAIELGSGTAASGWLDTGYALAGSAGVLPVLEGTGDLSPLSTGIVQLLDAAPNALVLIFASEVAGYVPVKGGTLVPFPILGTVVASTDALGGLQIAYTWPAEVVSGKTLHAQAWIVDDGAPFGLSASNALSATAP
jgi:hypothetical protein